MLIHLDNFMSHDSTVIGLPKTGVVLITGPNGAGKSAVVEALSMALWGKGLRGRWSPWRPGVKGGVIITDDDVQVSRRWDGKSKSLTLRQGAGFDTSTKAQVVLESLVGDHEVWRRTCVFSSSDAAHFTTATDSERKSLLEALLGLGWFDEALGFCRADLHLARTAKGVAEAEVTQLGQRLAGLQAVDVPEPGEAEDVGLLRAKVARLREILADAVSDRVPLVAARDRIYPEIGALSERAREAEDRHTKLVSGVCPLCEQSVNSDMIKRISSRVAEAKDTLKRAQELVHVAASSVASDIEEASREIDELTKQLGQATTKLKVVEATSDQRRRLVDAASRMAVEISSVADRIAAATEAVGKAAVDVSELEACETILGVRGVRAHVLGQTLGAIEALANTWLTRLSSTITMQLRAYTEKKSGGVTESISLTLVGAGGEHGYQGASAGERRRVDVAVLLAMAEMAGSAPGTGTWRGPIFFDEVFDSLDVDGRDAVMSLVRELAIDRCVVLITHNEALAEIDDAKKLRVEGGRVA